VSAAARPDAGAAGAPPPDSALATPLMQQYLEIKARHPGAVLFFRMGDFYETFLDDAVTVSRALGITLTSRNNGGSADVPLAGVPARSCAEYVRRLVARGFRVAICEQVEDPKQAKGVVRRAVVETVTPGAAFADELLDGARNNFLCAVAADAGRVALAAADVSTGELRLATVPRADADALLARYAPREVLVARGAAPDAGCGPDDGAGSDAPGPGALPPALLAGVLLTAREPWEFDPALAAEELARQFGVRSAEGLGLVPEDALAVGAAGALLRYVRELQPAGVPHLARPVVERAGAAMPLDEMTRRNLELVESLRPGAEGGDAEGTLVGVLDRTATPMGARLLRRWLLAPLVDRPAILARLDAVGALAGDALARAALREALDGVRDVERLAAKAAAARATPRELRALGDSLGRLPAVQAALGRVAGAGAAGRGGDGGAAVILGAAMDRSDGTSTSRVDAGRSGDPSVAALPQEARPPAGAASRLAALLAAWDDCADLAAEVCAALVERPPLQLGDEPTVAPGVDAALDEARALRDGGRDAIAHIQQAERARTGIASLKVGYNRVFGYFLEVSNAHRGAVPADYQRRQTLTGGERYVTPALKQYEERVLSAAEEIERRERELFEALRARVGAQAARLQRVAAGVAELDVLAALAEVAEREGYVRPDVTDGYDLDIAGGRHPVVERMMARERFIPNDLRLTEDARVVILTGPNMAGKSTVLRQAGLIVLMAQVGSFVPAARATVGVVDRLFTRVGASDNLVRGQSTFMVEMTETSAILAAATRRSLVLLDEVGRGTSTYDGVSIAWSVSEHLHDAVGCKTVFATHYHELVALADELPAVRNLSVEVREAGGRVLFLHRLVEGGASRSYGIEVGRLAGLPEPVLQRAREVLAVLEGEGAAIAVARGSKHAPVGRRARRLAADAGQLGLFAPPPAPPPAPAAPHPVVDELRALDADHLTPMQALALVARLSAAARG
jgi:DNA mismatch repair protein MutS